MKQVRVVIAFLLFPLMFLVMHDAQAGFITTGCVNANISCTLTELFNGGKIIEGEYLFSNWAITYSSQGTEVIPDAIDVSIATGAPIAGLQFSPNQSALIPTFTLWGFHYTYTVSNIFTNYRLRGASLAITSFPRNDYIQFFESIDTPITNDIYKMSVWDNAGGSDPDRLSDSVSFPVSPWIAVNTNIQSDTRWTQFSWQQNFIPEPSSIPLISVAVGLLSLMHRRREILNGRRHRNNA